MLNTRHRGRFLGTTGRPQGNVFFFFFGNTDFIINSPIVLLLGDGAMMRPFAHTGRLRFVSTASPG
jgi:hypothetical protein